MKVFFKFNSCKLDAPRQNKHEEVMACNTSPITAPLLSEFIFSSKHIRPRPKTITVAS